MSLFTVFRLLSAKGKIIVKQVNDENKLLAFYKGPQFVKKSTEVLYETVGSLPS